MYYNNHSMKRCDAVDPKKRCHAMHDGQHGKSLKGRSL